MQTLALVDLIKYVVTSWQVIAITVGILIYLNIVFYVSRKHRSPSSIVKMGDKKQKKKKEKAESAPPGGPEETGGGKDTNEELGLEEA